MNLSQFKDLLNEFEMKYPDEVQAEWTAFMNQVSARILKVGETFHTTVIVEKKYGSMRIEAKSKYVGQRIRQEARQIMEEEVCQIASRLILKQFCREVKL